MRLAVLSDIHGNQIALQAVLADLQQAGGADRTWILGDLVMAGPRPAECLQIIRDLQAASPKTVEVIGGNTDRYLVTGQQRGEKVKNAENWAKFPEQLRVNVERIAWLAEKLSWENAEYLQKILHRELELDVPGYGWVIGFHAVPGDDDVFYELNTPDDVLLDALYEREGRLALCGHTHHRMDRDLGKWRLINVGSVGLPNDDLRASYAILTFEADQLQVDLRLVPFDSEAVIADMALQQHPSLELVTHILRTGKLD
jgi:predicted phosphodiesterase